MMAGDPRPPRLGRWILALFAERPARDEYEADLLELFKLRTGSHGLSYARRRYVSDAVSLLRSRRRRAGAAKRRRLFSFAGSILGDMRFALRLFRREAGVMTLATIGLALASGVTTTAFSIVNTIQLRPLGVPNAETIVHVHQNFGRQGVRYQWEFADYVAVAGQSRLLRAEPWLEVSVRVTDTGSPADVERARPVQSALVGATFFDTFNGRARIGRLLGPADDQPAAPPVAVVSHVYWRSRFGADPAVVGRTIFVSGAPVTIVGVSDAAFTGPFEIPPVIWQPLGSAHAVHSWLDAFTPGNRQSINVIARLTSEGAAQAAEAEASGLLLAASSAGTTDVPATRRGPTGVRLLPAEKERNGDSVGVTALVLGIVGLVVLLACTNVANLLLAGATSRQQEIAARLALGASRRRIVRQLVTESVMVSLVAGALGLAVAMWLIPAVTDFVDAPPGFDFAPDIRVYAFVTVVSLVAGVGAGLAPARYGTGGDMLTPLKGGVRQNALRPNRVRRVFVGVQAAASMVLLVLATLFGRAAWQSTFMDLGFDPSKLMTGQVRMRRGDAAGTRTAAFLREGLARAGTLPGIDAAAIALFQPLGGSHMPLLLPPGMGHLVIHENRTSPSYFHTVGLTMVRGRAYTDAETRDGAPVAVISARLARDLWGDADPIGRPLDRLQGRAQSGYPDLSAYRVVGVASDAVGSRLELPHARHVYLPLLEGDMSGAAHLIVRTHTPAATSGRPVQQALQAIDPELRVYWALTTDHLQRSLAPIRTISTLTGILGALALGLAVVGLFGVTALVVRQRLTEVSVRVAIGATARDIRRLLLVDSLRPVAIGLVFGLVIALAGGQFLASVLYGVSPRDPFAMLLATGALGSAAIVAVLIPARRALRVDPVRLLRQT
jgi:predicted permease